MSVVSVVEVVPVAKKPGRPYAEIRPQMRTFDLLLFKGGDFVSKAISKIERFEDGTRVPDFTHVGCVMLGEDLIPTARESESKWLRHDVYVFESTASGGAAGGPKDATGRARFGVQLRRLDDVVASYDAPESTRLAWAPLKPEVRAKVDVGKAREEYEKYKGLRYGASFVDLAATGGCRCARAVRDCGAFRCLRDRFCCFCTAKRADYSPNTKKTDNKPSKWKVCSELVADVYKDIGVFSDAVVADNVIPVDFLTDPDHPEKTFDADRQVPPACMPFVRYHA